jgi:predicted ATP-dependent protease
VPRIDVGKLKPVRGTRIANAHAVIPSLERRIKCRQQTKMLGKALLDPTDRSRTRLRMDRAAQSGKLFGRVRRSYNGGRE